MTATGRANNGGTAAAAAAAAAPPIADRKLRILCLHGYLQNGEVRRVQSAGCGGQFFVLGASANMSPPSPPCVVQVFRSRIGSLRKALKSRAEFVFVDAPFAVAPEATSAQAVAESGGSSGAVGRSWW